MISFKFCRRRIFLFHHYLSLNRIKLKTAYKQKELIVIFERKFQRHLPTLFFDIISSTTIVIRQSSFLIVR